MFEAAKQLTQLSHKLRTLVDQFKLKEIIAESLLSGFDSPVRQDAVSAEVNEREEVRSR